MASISLLNRVCLRGVRPLQNGILSNIAVNNINYDQQRGIRKHWKPEFKWLRTKKVVKIEMPNLQEKEHEVPQEEKNRRMREKGVKPARPWVERPFSLSCTGDVLEPYVPPEGDGKRSVFTTTGAKQNVELLSKKSKSYMTIRKIRQYDDDFDTSAFAEMAQEIYMNAHQCLANKDKYTLREYVTEKAYGEMRHNTHNVTIRWKFLQSLEPPKIVYARQTNVISKENIFAQVTVRFHTQQTLAVYDRFGRLMHGSEILAKDVLEYAVFEKNVSNEYGTWRLHGKIIPDWMPPREPRLSTWRFVEEEPSDDANVEKAIESIQVPEKVSDGSAATKPPPLVTA